MKYSSYSLADLIKEEVKKAQKRRGKSLEELADAAHYSVQPYGHTISVPIEQIDDHFLDAIRYNGVPHYIQPGSIVTKVALPEEKCWHKWKLDFDNPFTSRRYESCERCGAKKEELWGV